MWLTRLSTSTGCGSTPCTRSSDASEVHLLEEMAIEVAALSAHLRRPLTLIAESDLNDPLLVTPARGRRLRPRRAVERRLPPRRARGADRRDRAATTPTSSRCPRWPRCASRASSTTAPSRRSAAATTASPIDTARDAHLAAGGLHPEPRPDRQPRRRRPAHRDARRRPARLRGAAHAGRAVHADAVPGRGVGGLDAVPVLHLAPRAGARQGHRRGPDRASSSGWAGTRRSCPTRRTRRRSERSKLDWSELGAGRHARDAGGVPTARRAAPLAARSSPTRRSRGSRAPSTRSARVFTMRRGDLDGGRELRRRPGERRRGRHRCCTSAPVPRCRWTAPCPCRRTRERWSGRADVGRHATYLRSHPPRPGDGAGCSSPSGTPGGIVD